MYEFKPISQLEKSKLKYVLAGAEEEVKLKHARELLRGSGIRENR